MTCSERALSLVKAFEGFRAEAYKCPAGKWTLGYGDTEGVSSGMTTTREEADARLAQKLAAVAEDVLECVHVPLTQAQLDALCTLVYNIGLGNFHSSTLLKHLNARRYEDAAKEFDRWIFASGRALNGLKARRAAEKSLFLGA